METRDLADWEISALVWKGFRGEHRKRDVLIFLFGISTRLRIQEILKVERRHVESKSGDVREWLSIESGLVKQSRPVRVKLSNFVKSLLREWLSELSIRGACGKRFRIFDNLSGTMRPDVFRVTFWRSMKRACMLAGVNSDRVGTHSIKKTGLRLFYFDAKRRELNGEKLDALLMARDAAHHKNLSSTEHYMQFMLGKEVDKSVLAVGEELEKLVVG